MSKKIFFHDTTFQKVVEKGNASNGYKARYERVLVRVELEVDTLGLMDQLGRKALANKSKKSSEVGGLVVVRVSNERAL